MRQGLSFAPALRRKVLPIVGAYLAAGWGLLQFVSWATDRYTLSSSLVDLLTGLWLLPLPFITYFAWRSPPEDIEAASTAPAESGSIAVLPFSNHSANDEDAFLSDGITEEITNTLSRIEGLHVAASSSVFAVKDRHLGPRALGRILHVRHVLEGSVRRSGDRLRVTTQLVDAQDGFQLWAAKWDEQMADVFAIEDEIASNVTSALRSVLRIEGSAAPLVPRTHPKAYEYYLRGRKFYRQTRKKSLGYAREMFRRAIELDPGYATAHAALADSITLELMYYFNSDVSLAEADQASQRALELDPHLAEAHSARGGTLLQLHRFAEAEAEFKTAMTINPRLFEACYLYARMCFQLGRLDDAARLFAQATTVCEDYQAAFFLAQTHEALGHTAQTPALYQAALEITERHMELHPDDARAATVRSTALCRLGKTKEALEWAARAVDIDPLDAGVCYNVACTYSLAGEVDRAIECLENAVRTGFGNPDWLKRDPDLAPLRSNPAFLTLLDRLQT